MRRILICTGVLGGGTAMTFAAAALVWTMFPNGPMIAASANQFMIMKGGVAVPVPMPAPAGPLVIDDTVVDGGGALTPEEQKQLQLKLQNAGRGAPNVVVDAAPVESPEP